MNTFSLVLAVLLAVAQDPQAEPKASIRGRVLAEGTASLTLRGIVDMSTIIGRPITTLPTAPTQSTVAGRDGEFRFTDIAPGTYYLKAEAEGYVASEIGPLDLNISKDLSNVVFRLVRGAAVSGRVVTTAGTPIEGMDVVLARAGFDAAGRPVSSAVVTARTDDRGEYRLSGFAAGNYYLLSRAPFSRFTPGQRIAIPPGTTLESFINTVPGREYGVTLYPGAVELDRATALRIKPGDDLTHIDFVLTAKSAHTIRGRVVDKATGEPLAPPLQSGPRFQGPTLGIFPVPALAVNGSSFPTRIQSDGTFEISNVIPGRYVIIGVMESAPEPQSNYTTPGRLAVVNVEVGPSDLDNVVVAFPSSVVVQGRLRLEGRELQTLAGFERIRMDFYNPTPLGIPTTVNPVREHTPVQADGTFRYNGIVEGNYALRVSSLPRGVYVKDITSGSSSSLGGTIPVFGEKAAFEVVLSTNAARVDGTLIDGKDQPVGVHEVILIPKDLRDRRDLYKRTTTDSNGRFSFDNVPPGDYKLFSWESTVSNAFFDADFVRTFDGHGKTVTVAESATETVWLTVIPE